MNKQSSLAHAIKEKELAKKPDPVLLAYLVKEFEKLHNEHLAILKKVDDVTKVVSPALESEVRKAAGMALVIDKKVPDKHPLPPEQPKTERKKPLWQ